MFFKRKEPKRRRKLFAVIGLGGFGFFVAKRLKELGAEVIAIDQDESKARDYADIFENFYILDATDEKALKEAGVAEADTAIVSVGERVEASAIIVMNLQNLGVKEIIAKAVTDIHARLLHRLGVNKVIHPEREMALRLAKTLINPSIMEELVLSEDLAISEFEVPKSFLNKTLRELNLRRNYGINVVALRRGLNWESPPDPDSPLREHDVMLVIGSIRSLEKIEVELQG